MEDFYATDCRIQPIGLAYLAGSLKKNFPGMEVSIYDTLAGGEKRSIPWPREFAYLKRFYGHPDRGPFALFHHYWRFGQSEATILGKLKEYEPLLIGISSLFSPYYRQSLALARLCRQIFPTVPIVMGGNHATLHPETLLRPDSPFGSEERLCDFVLRGECEESICELVACLLGRRSAEEIPGLVVRGKGGSSSGGPVTPRRDSIPEPEFDGLDPTHYTFDRRPMTFLVTSRSCPHRCSFCSIHAVFGERYETRPVESVIGEIQRRYDQGIRHFDVEDDNFTFRRGYVIELFERIADLGLPITFSAMNGLSYLSLDDEILLKMRQAGFATLNIALVSSDRSVLEFTSRPHTLERFFQVVGAATRLGFRITAYLILGMPGQTVEEMWRTVKTLSGSPCLVGASPFYFTPGSPIHRRERDNPAIRLASSGKDPFFSARLTALDLETGDFDRVDVYTLLRLTRVLNYMKKGLDAGYSPDHEFFGPALQVLQGRRWFARAGKSVTKLPFSRRVADLIAREEVLVRGYRTQRALVWRPERECLQGL